MRLIKMYEKETVEAVQEQSEEKAVQALGNLHHITILKTGDTALIFYGKHQIASVLTLQSLDAVKLKAMDMDADPEGALQIFLYYMQVRENSYMSIESGLAKRPLRNFLHPHRMNPGFIHMTGNLHHITILKTGDTALIFYGIKMYEKETVEAVQEQSEEKAVQALMLHPLINSYSLAKELVAAYSQAYGGRRLFPDKCPQHRHAAFQFP